MWMWRWDGTLAPSSGTGRVGGRLGSSHVHGVVEWLERPNRGDGRTKDACQAAGPTGCLEGGTWETRATDETKKQI